MNSVFAVLCCCYFSCSIGSTVPESTTALLLETEPIFMQGDELIRDRHSNKTFLKLGSELLKKLNDMNETKTSLESSKNKINESELYENGQTVKENSERAFIFINQKFKSLWFDGKRPTVPKTKFKSAEEFKQFDNKIHKGSSIGVQSVKGNNQPGHADQTYNDISNTYSYNSAYFSPVLAAPGHITKEKEYIELPKKPLVQTIPTPNQSGNVKTNPQKAAIEFFRSQDDDLPKEQYYNDDEDSVVPKIAIQNQHHTHTKCNHRDPNTLLFERFPITYYEKSNDVNDFEDDKLDYIRNALKQDVSENEINNSMYNCYNDKCNNIVNEYNQRKFNGIRRGYLCVCDHSNTEDRAGRQDVSTEITDFEAVIKETESLNKLSEGKTNAFD